MALRGRGQPGLHQLLIIREGKSSLTGAEQSAFWGSQKALDV